MVTALVLERDCREATMRGGCVVITDLVDRSHSAKMQNKTTNERRKLVEGNEKNET